MATTGPGGTSGSHRAKRERPVHSNLLPREKVAEGRMRGPGPHLSRVLGAVGRAKTQLDSVCRGLCCLDPAYITTGPGGASR